MLICAGAYLPGGLFAPGAEIPVGTAFSPKADADGHHPLLPTTLQANKKGSMLYKYMPSYGQLNVASMYPPADERDWWVVWIMDGWGGHMTEEFLEWCLKNKIDVILRWPHSSNVSLNPNFPKP
jgi:hypothetical protein